MDIVVIADHAIQTADGSFSRLLSAFRAENTDQTPICRVDQSFGVNQYGVLRLTPTDFKVAHTLSLTTNPSVFLTADEEFTRSEIFGFKADDESLMRMLLVAIYSRLAYFRTAFAHAALVDVPGKGGLLFVGRSGVGKTTQAMLWEQYRGAEIINGDKVFLSMKDGTVIAHGSPWRGNSPYVVNRSVPLRGIVALGQAPDNRIRSLSMMQALTEYVPHIFLPQWDQKLTDMVMQTVSAMLPLVPVYHLDCRPDEEAVRLTHDAVFG